ncbi:MAG: ABC transporter ATP-binding protein [Clostridia bacterium]|nr:ABC transporter ATP-binding protein [Clostridia bacterium]
MLKRFLAYYKPHKKIFTLDMLASFASALIGLVYPIVTRKMLNDLIPNKNYSLIVAFGLALLALYFVCMLLQYFIQYQGHIMGVKMQAQMRSDMFKHLQKLPFSFYDNHETGKIMSRMTNDLFDITELAHHGPENIIISSITVIISFIYLSTINIWLALIIFTCVPLLIFISSSTRKRMKNAFRLSKQAVAKINASLQSSISGIRVTKAFTNSEKEIEKFEEGNSQFKEASREAYKAMGIFHSSTTFVTNIFNVVVLIAGGLFLYGGKITFADYSAFIVSVNLFISPITTLIRFMESFQNGVTGFERFIEVLDTPPEPERTNAKSAERLKGNISFKNVSCSYSGSKEVLKNINLDIKQGETFALVGPSGGGKTTACHLIPHFYETSSGEITIDGINIEDLTLESLRRNIGIVQQDIYLFNSSIKENILYGCYEATDEEVIEAAKRAGIHEYIMSLENGYDTVIGERGVRLSGGQKQRLCIARVFLKNPPILILDEATSALDSITEIMIQKSLDELCQGRTTVVVAHRLSTIKNADRIAVIADGKVAEEGTHSALLEKNGMYAELYNQQYKEGC